MAILYSKTLVAASRTAVSGDSYTGYTTVYYEGFRSTSMPLPQMGTLAGSSARAVVGGLGVYVEAVYEYYFTGVAEDTSGKVMLKLSSASTGWDSIHITNSSGVKKTYKRIDATPLGSGYYRWDNTGTTVLTSSQSYTFEIDDGISIVDPDPGTISTNSPVGYGSTSFQVTSTGGSALTTYRVREGSYGGNVLKTWKGNNTVTVISTPSLSGTTYYVDAYVLSTDGGAGSAANVDVTEITVTRSAAIAPTQPSNTYFAYTTSTQNGTLTNYEYFGESWTRDTTSVAIPPTGTKGLGFGGYWSSYKTGQQFRIATTIDGATTYSSVSNVGPTYAYWIFDLDVPVGLAEGETLSLKMQIRVPAANNGDDTWYDVTTNSPKTVLRHYSSGTLKEYFCSGYDSYGRYWDGSGGTYDTLLESNSATCGYGNVPDSFTLADQTGKEPDATYTSTSTVTVAGLSDNNITISASLQSTTSGATAETRVRTSSAAAWGAWSSSSKSVKNDYQVQVRLTTGTAFSTSYETTLNIGGVTSVFSVSTRAANTTPTVVMPANISDSNKDITYVRSFTVSGLEALITLSVTGDATISTSETGTYTTSIASAGNGTYWIKLTSSSSDSTSVSGTVEGSTWTVSTTGATTSVTANRTFSVRDYTTTGNDFVYGETLKLAFSTVDWGYYGFISKYSSGVNVAGLTLDPTGTAPGGEIKAIFGAGTDHSENGSAWQIQFRNGATGDSGVISGKIYSPAVAPTANWETTSSTATSASFNGSWKLTDLGSGSSDAQYVVTNSSTAPSATHSSWTSVTSTDTFTVSLTRGQSYWVHVQRIAGYTLSGAALSRSVNSYPSGQIAYLPTTSNITAADKAISASATSAAISLSSSNATQNYYGESGGTYYGGNLGSLTMPSDTLPGKGLKATYSLYTRRTTAEGGNDAYVDTTDNFTIYRQPGTPLDTSSISYTVTETSSFDVTVTCKTDTTTGTFNQYGFYTPGTGWEWQDSDTKTYTYARNSGSVSYYVAVRNTDTGSVSSDSRLAGSVNVGYISPTNATWSRPSSINYNASSFNVTLSVVPDNHTYLLQYYNAGWKDLNAWTSADTFTVTNLPAAASGSKEDYRLLKKRSTESGGANTYFLQEQWQVTRGAPTAVDKTVTVSVDSMVYLDTSFTVDITNAASASSYDIRTDSYTGTIVGSFKGTESDVVVNHQPSTSGTTYYITGYVAFADNGDDSVSNISTFTATRPAKVSPDTSVVVKYEGSTDTAFNRSAGDTTVVTFDLSNANSNGVTDYRVYRTLGAGVKDTYTGTSTTFTLDTGESLSDGDDWIYIIEAQVPRANNGDDTWAYVKRIDFEQQFGTPTLSVSHSGTGESPTVSMEITGAPEGAEWVFTYNDGSNIGAFTDPSSNTHDFTTLIRGRTYTFGGYFRVNNVASEVATVTGYQLPLIAPNAATVTLGTDASPDTTINVNASGGAGGTIKIAIDGVNFSYDNATNIDVTRGSELNIKARRDGRDFNSTAYTVNSSYLVPYLEPDKTVSIAETNISVGSNTDTKVLSFTGVGSNEAIRVISSAETVTGSLGSGNITVTCPADGESLEYTVQIKRGISTGGDNTTWYDTNYISSNPITITRTANAAPILNSFIVSPSPTIGAQTVTITASTETDTDGTINSIDITQESGTSVSLSATTYTAELPAASSIASRTFTSPNENGVLEFKVVVTDDDGATTTSYINLLTNKEGTVITPPSGDGYGLEVYGPNGETYLSVTDKLTIIDSLLENIKILYQQEYSANITVPSDYISAIRLSLTNTAGEPPITLDEVAIEEVDATTIRLRRLTGYVDTTYWPEIWVDLLILRS